MRWELANRSRPFTMRREIKARYWRLAPIMSGGVSFASALRRIHSITPPGSRQFKVEAGYFVRLERLETSGSLIAGEMYRVQTDGIPPLVTPDGAKPMELEGGGGFGHASTFVATADGESVLWHQDDLGCSPRKLGEYLAGFADPAYRCDPTPYATKDLWHQLRKAKRIRSIQVKAVIREQRDLYDDQEMALGRLAKECVAEYGGSSFDLSIVAENARSHGLSPGPVKGTMEAVVSRSDTRKARVEIDGEAGAILLDFLKGHKSVAGRIERFPDDLEKDFKSRKDYLLGAFDASLNHDPSDA